MVSLDEFIVFNTPNHSYDNKHYIGSDRLKTLTYAFLIGDNKIYQRHKSYWLLKAVLVEDKLLVDYSFEDIDLLEEQILILSAFDRVVTIKWETLWEYFNVADIEDLNNISRQLVDRRLDEIANPIKAVYNQSVDDGKTILTFEEWELEMGLLFSKWKDCEKVRLVKIGNGTNWAEGFLNERTLKEFAIRYYNNEITFYEMQTVVEQDEYSKSVEELGLSTGLNERDLLANIAIPFEDYVNLMRRLTHTRLTEYGVIHHATVIHNYHNLVVEDELEEVLEEEIDYPF